MDKTDLQTYTNCVTPFMKNIAAFLTVAMCSFLAHPARAERDIVYGARYYFPVGSRANKSSQKSHFHLYRINADGTRRMQITFGAHDDVYPQWSPDGRRILFIREESLYLVGANGGPVTKFSDDYGGDGVRWSPDGRFICALNEDEATGPSLDLFDSHTLKQVRRFADVTHFDWSPDGTHLVLQTDKTTQILDWKTSVTKSLQGPLKKIIWLDGKTLLGLESPPKSANDDNPFEFLRAYDSSGTLKRRFRLALPLDKEGLADEVLQDWRSTLQISSQPAFAIFVGDDSTSSGQNYAFYGVNVESGAGVLWASGNDLTFARDGKRFLWTTYHDETPYDTNRFGHARVVYTTKLQLGSVNGTRPKTLVDGLVFVQGCDWR